MRRAVNQIVRVYCGWSSGCMRVIVLFSAFCCDEQEISSCIWRERGIFSPFKKPPFSVFLRCSLLLFSWAIKPTRTSLKVVYLFWMTVSSLMLYCMRVRVRVQAVADSEEAALIQSRFISLLHSTTSHKSRYLHLLRSFSGYFCD